MTNPYDRFREKRTLAQFSHTFVAGFTDVDNFDFQPDDAYHQTKRITANLLFSPIPRVDIGAELLWGERTNKDSSSADALQLQIAAKYIF